MGHKHNISTFTMSFANQDDLFAEDKKKKETNKMKNVEEKSSTMDIEDLFTGSIDNLLKIINSKKLKEEANIVQNEDDEIHGNSNDNVEIVIPQNKQKLMISPNEVITEVENIEALNDDDIMKYVQLEDEKHSKTLFD